MIRFAAILAALALATPAAAATQFDLLCTGTSTGPAKSDPKPWSARYSIDLAAMAYCEQPCVSPRPIARIEPGRLYLVDMSERIRDTPPLIFIDRVTGALTGQDDYPTYYKAECALAPFTAFPPTRF